MNITLVALRAVTYVAAMLMFGASLFVIYSPGRRGLDAQDEERDEWRALRRSVWQLQLACGIATLVAGLAWLVIHSAAVAGVPILRAVTAGVAGEIFLATWFGRAMALHLGLALVLIGILVSRGAVVARSPLRSDLILAILSAGILATLAWTGHAAATRGSDRYVHLGSDVVHLLAAGTWLGALPLLAVILIRAAHRQSPALDRTAVRTIQRFSPIGVACVGALIVTGWINAGYLVATWAALFGTMYGQLLLLKLALFALMLAFAARNRFILTPRLEEAVHGRDDASRAEMRYIARNAWIESILAVVIVVIVGALGITVPGAHTEISWPLSFTFDANALDEDHPLEHAFSGLILTALVAAGVAAHSFRRGHKSAGWAAAVVATSAIALFGHLFVVPAHPTTYARPPVRYTTATIASGATLYQSNCAACHGGDGHGDGLAAASLPIRPANLTSGHAVHHHPGDLYWWIARGIPGTPMPGFDGRLTPEQVWQLVTFLHAVADAQGARGLTSEVGNWRPIVAPDFPFEIAGGEQETLVEQRGHRAVLVVLYAYPESRTRLTELSKARETLERAGVRVIAVPFDAEASGVSNAEGVDPALLALCDPSVAAVYSLFLPKLPEPHGGSPERHAEVLVDRAGYLRSVRIGANDASIDRISRLVQDADRLSREPAHPPESRTHMH